MRILFLAPTYQDLYKPILEELKKVHEVYYMKDIELPTDSFHANGNPLKKAVFSLYNRIFHVYEKYWDRMFENQPELNKPFDVLFCIQGVSVCHVLIDYLRKINPNIFCTLYIWDALRYYDYGRNTPLFDKCYSFDYHDAENNPEINFLPFYWVGCDNASDEIKYDLSLVGNDHDGRFAIINSLIPEIQRQGLTHFIKIKPIDEYSCIPLMGKIYRTLFLPVVKRRMLQNFKDCLASPLCLRKNMSVEEVEEIIRQSKCILDTDRESQTGTTPRVIWALSQGKGILTTNRKITKMPFYNENQIRIFDRNKPSLDIEFIKSYKSLPVSKEIENLRIDKWIVNFICI